MGSKSSILEEAMSLVDQERSYLREERCAYERFRERVRLATPDSADDSGRSATTENLLVAYREEVMEALDHKTVYGDTLAESIEEELSPVIADILVTKRPLTQRRKRDLLVDTTRAIERREKFCADLDDERAALKMYAEELANVREALEKLPACSAQELHIEKLLVVWEVYDTLLEHCEQLLERRQRKLHQSERRIEVLGKQHALNEYLYIDLETGYPVLWSIANTLERLEQMRTGGEMASPSDIKMEK